jgi:glycosyltransferase involved in cell wall biosynthesis
MNPSPLPFFSVLIPSYNRPESITQCIESVLANQGEDFEIIISDDASPRAEAVSAAIRPYLSRRNIRFHQQYINRGEPANRNFLVSEATGRYNIILADDDQLLPHALRTIRANIDRVPDQDLYMFGYRVVDGAGRTCYDRVAPKPLLIGPEDPSSVQPMFEATWLPFLVCHPATFCCRQGVEKAIPYRDDVYTADDYMFLLQCLIRMKRVYVVPECLMTYQWSPHPHDQRQVNQSSDNLKVLQAFARVYYALQQEPGLHPLIDSFVQGYEYRKRFLYDLVIRRTPVRGHVSDIGLLPAHCRELVAYIASRPRWMVCLKTAAEIVRDLADVFGLKGCLYSLQIGFAFFRHRIMQN